MKQLDLFTNEIEQEIITILKDKKVDIPELIRSKDVQSYNMNHWSESQDLETKEFKLLKTQF